jgi:hypothetical protein
MKKLLLILLMLLSVCAFAQRKKHAKKKSRRIARHSVRESRAEEEVATEETPTYPFISVDSATKKMVLVDPPLEQDRPLVIINDNIYTGRLADIKRENILDVSVIRKKGAVMMYGQKAAGGALIIKTKQPLPANLPSMLLPLPKQQPDKKSFIFNEEVTFGKIEDLDQAKILSIDTLIQPKFVGSKENDTTLNVTTKVYAKKLYQWKFGTLSKAYKTYIRSRRGSDNGVNYVLSDGTTLTGGKEEDLGKLLKVYNSDPKAVEFTGPRGTRNNRIPATLTIELNQLNN